MKLTPKAPSVARESAAADDWRSRLRLDLGPTYGTLGYSRERLGAWVFPAKENPTGNVSFPFKGKWPLVVREAKECTELRQEIALVLPSFHTLILMGNLQRSEGSDEAYRLRGAPIAARFCCASKEKRLWTLLI